MAAKGLFVVRLNLEWEFTERNVEMYSENIFSSKVSFTLTKLDLKNVQNNATVASLLELLLWQPFLKQYFLGENSQKMFYSTLERLNLG